MLLIISELESEAQAVRNIFYYLGVVSYASACRDVTEDTLKIFPAVLATDCRGEAFAELFENFSERLSEKLLFLRGGDTEVRSERIYRLPSTLSFPELASRILLGEGAAIARYSTPRISADFRRAAATVNGTELFLTKTELMIVRLLCATHPTWQSAESIRRLCWKSGQLPEISNVRTHVSVINRKSRRALGSSLISSENRLGYRLID